VGLWTVIVDHNQRHKRELEWQRRAASQWNADTLHGLGAHLVLDTIDQSVAFFDDRCEYRRRLGSKHGVIDYSTVRAARLAKKTGLSISRPSSETFESTIVFTKKMVLKIASRQRPLVFDFRSEPFESVQEALAIVERGMARPASRVEPSRADELAKLANLRDAGVLTDEEFEREKARILKS
jgi:hypothetical protein